MSHPRSSRVSVATLALTPQVVGGAVAVSERVVRDARFLSNPVFEFDIVFAESALGKDVLARDNPGISPDQANTLDVRGIVKLGSQVRHGDVLVSKLRPTTQSDLTHEEKLLHAIFGNQLGNLRNDSLQYTNLDPGEVVSVQLRAKERGTCNQCGDVNASDGKCPYCGGPFPWVQTDLFDKSAAFMEVVVGVSITRNLALGDVLQDDQGNKVVIAQIIPDEPEARTDMWLHPDSPLAARFKGGEALHTVALTKTTTQVEDKVRARATGPYSLITQMPLGNFCPGQTVTQDTVRALFQAGYRRNLVEMLTIKSDAVDGRGLAYEACLNGEQVPLGVPESTYKLASYLKALCIDMRLSNRQDDVVESVDLDGGANPDGELLLEFAGARAADILGWSSGLVKKPETINYRTYRPENDGLFCERIFGPERDWECACGKFRGMKYKGTICDRCGVKIDRNLVRRRRMGHIDLAAPVVHRWFVSADAGLARLLGLASEDLDNIVYRQDFVVTEPGATDFALHQLLTSEEVDEARARFRADGFKVSTGAEAIRALLGAKHLGQLDWIIVDTLPVLPPDLRPLVLLDNGNFATSDLNDLYRRVVNRNNRLRKLGDLKAPENVIESEKRQLQECVDALFDNENLRRPVLGDSNRPLKSLGEMLAYALEDLGNKRSDYSARGVVIPDATLQAGREIGLPAEVVQTLFKVWALRIAQGVSKATCVKAAAKWLDQEENSPQALDVYRQVLPGRPVLVIADAQRFAGLQPILVEGEAIRLHPDDARALAIGFAGEQLTLHVPLSLAASAELSDPRPQPKISSLLDTLTPNDLVARMATAHDPLHLGPFDRALLGVDR